VGRKVHESVAYLLLCYVDVYPHLNNKLLLIMCQYLDMLKDKRTGVCFTGLRTAAAAKLFNWFGRGDQVTITSVPCTPGVEALLK